MLIYQRVWCWEFHLVKSPWFCIAQKTCRKLFPGWLVRYFLHISRCPTFLYFGGVLMLLYDIHWYILPLHLLICQSATTQTADLSRHSSRKLCFLLNLIARYLNSLQETYSWVPRSQECKRTAFVFKFMQKSRVCILEMKWMHISTAKAAVRAVACSVGRWAENEIYRKELRIPTSIPGLYDTYYTFIYR